MDEKFKRIKFDENFKSEDIFIEEKIYVAECNEKTCYIIGNFIEEHQGSFTFNWEVKIKTNNDVKYIPRNFPFAYTAKNDKAVILIKNESLKDYEILVPIKKETKWKERL